MLSLFWVYDVECSINLNTNIHSIVLISKKSIKYSLGLKESSVTVKYWLWSISPLPYDDIDKSEASYQYLMTFMGTCMHSGYLNGKT